MGAVHLCRTWITICFQAGCVLPYQPVVYKHKSHATVSVPLSITSCMWGRKNMCMCVCVFEEEREKR